MGVQIQGDAMGVDMPVDMALSPHFSFFEMTKTTQAELQERNRIEAMDYLDELKAMAGMLEKVRTAMAIPLNVHSAFRCAAVNGGTALSSKTSQHLRGQACDFTPASYDGSQASFDALFNEVAGILEFNKIGFGQLIKEQAERSYGVARWIHLSLGAPYRELARCGQVMSMCVNSEGIPIYSMIEQIKQEA